jgi:putative protease
LVAGDGLCYFDDEGKLKGFRVNKVEQGRVYPLEMPVIQPGTALFRNQDHAFDQLLAGKSAERKIRLQILLKETSEGFVVNMKDEDDFCLELAFPCEKTPAKNPEKVQENIIAQFSKSGNTPFAVTEVQVEISQPWFFPVSVLNEWRRASLAAFENHRIEGYVREIPAIKKSAEYPEKQLTYLGNVTNQLAFSFYKEHGVENIMPGFEVKAEDNVPLMFTRHCIKYEMGWCPKTGKKDTPPEPFKLRHQNYNFRLEFDCKACEMRVLAAKS